MITNFQLLSGADIEIEYLQEAPYSRERETEVLLKGTSEQIYSAEKLINDLIEEVDGVRVPPGADELVIQFPNDKVCFLLGVDLKGKRKIQESSGAHIQVIPLKLPPGDPSTERDIKGDMKQIVSALKLINEEKYKALFRSNKHIELANRTRGYRHSPGPSQVHQEHTTKTQQFNKPSSPVAGRHWLNQSSTSPQRSSRERSYSSGYRERSASFL